ncbi:MAG: adenylate/guanylate cyclase domain-containing protein [Gammaproteobacteria bacterium]
MDDFERTLERICDALRTEARISYRMLRRRFTLSDEDLEDLKAELIDAKRVARDEDGKVLVWHRDDPSARASNAVAAAPSPASYTPSHLADRIRHEQEALASRGAEGERKTITILFADLKGSTALLEGLDPEVARAVIDPSLQTMMDAVHRYEGYVAQALGDGILALFGAPLAHEDHAQRAVLAALRMQEDLKRHSDAVRLKHGAPLAMRVGLNTGEVVVRSIRKDDLHTDYVPVGHSINLAARMEQMATPGTVLVTEHTAKFIEGFFALKSLGSAEVKGLEQPLAVFEVTGLGPLRTRLQVSARRGLTRFVGRRQELEAMQRALEEARAGRGQVIGIMGEPGMGKSRLVHEFKSLAAGFAVFEAYSASHGKASPYLPITELLKGYFQIQLQDDERTRREKVIGRLLGLDRGLEEVLPYYFALLNVEDADSPLPQMDPQLRRRRTFEALKKVTLRASLEQPVLIIFEDLHWIDSETQGFLDGLVESLGSARILLLTNYRPEYRHEWGGKTYCTQLRLAPFGRMEAEEFLGALLGEAADTPSATRLPGLKQWVLERTEGTPFFMEEVVQELFEQRVLQRDAVGRLVLAADATGTPQVPATVQGVLAARIDRLAVEEKSLLQQLSVIGREFPLALAREVVGWPEVTLLVHLGALQRKEFLYEQPAYPDVEYLFKHALTQDVAYHSLLGDTRKALHEKTARAIETRYSAELEDHYSALAHHYGRSDNSEKAIEFLEKAGLQAARRSAHVEARNHLEQAIVLGCAQPASTENRARELRLLLALASPLRITTGMTSTEFERLCERARVLCDDVGTRENRMRVQAELRVLRCVRGEARAALVHGRALLELASADVPREFRAQAYGAMCVCAFALANLDDTRHHAGEVERYCGPEDVGWHQQHFGYDPRLLVAAYAASAAALQGHVSQACERYASARLEAARLGMPYLQGFILSTCAWMSGFLGNLEVCQETGEAALAVAHEYGYPEWIVWGSSWLGFALARDEPERGIAMMEWALQSALEARAEFGLPSVYAALADACRWNGRLADARAAVDSGLALAARTDETLFLADLHRAHADLLLAEGGPPARALAEAEYGRSLALAKRQGAHWWELRATIGVARLWLEDGRGAEARQHLAEALAAITGGEHLPDVREAKMLLEASDERVTERGTP